MPLNPKDKTMNLNPDEAYRYIKTLVPAIDDQSRCELARRLLENVPASKRWHILQKIEDDESVTNPYQIDKRAALNRFREALLRVSPAYYQTRVPDSSSTFGERVFAYELYHQLRLRFDSAFYVHGEFRKGLSLLLSSCSDATIIPDIVIHQSDTLENNLIAVEIKSTPALTLSEILADIEKLEFLTRPSPLGGLNFQIGIMLIVNTEFSGCFRKAAKDNAGKLVRLVQKGPRVAIWNISSPVTADKFGHVVQEHCLTVFRSDRILELAQQDS